MGETEGIGCIGRLTQEELKELRESVLKARLYYCRATSIIKGGKLPSKLPGEQAELEKILTAYMQGKGLYGMTKLTNKSIAWVLDYFQRIGFKGRDLDFYDYGTEINDME